MAIGFEMGHMKMGSTKKQVSISARYLGPIFTLDAPLGQESTNLVFARNGTGKSFISRAFRYLDLHKQEKDISDAAINLVSDESPDSKGTIKVSSDGTVLGEMSLNKNDVNSYFVNDETIFHVFSEDFVLEELRENKFTVDGKTDHDIIVVGGENIKLEEAKKEQTGLKYNEGNLKKQLSAEFNVEKEQYLIDKAGISKNLGEYRALELEAVFAIGQTAEPPQKSLETIIGELDVLKSMPTVSESSYPTEIDPIHVNDIDFTALSASLKLKTSISSVFEGIRHKINEDPHFFQSGLRIVQGKRNDICPFCEQDITSPDPKKLIQAYEEYFDDAEEKHKSELRKYIKLLKMKKEEIEDKEKKVLSQKSKYDDLRKYIPSLKDEEYSENKFTAKDACKSLMVMIEQIEIKISKVSKPITLDQHNFTKYINSLNDALNQGNLKVSTLLRRIAKVNEERKKLQRDACLAFIHAFAMKSKHVIEKMDEIRKNISLKQIEIEKLEESMPAGSSKKRFANTFSEMLKHFFDEKYSLDHSGFKLKRNDIEMARGPHRTLSDGEKTVIAFCYFVASAHRKIKSDSDYKNIFWVFDDPVTSLSYDFIFDITQAVKNLRISEQGEISINFANQQKQGYDKPELLIFTHSSYFFNLLSGNNIVSKNSLFSLHSDGKTHNITLTSKIIPPFENQLEHIYHVANGQEPNASTANNIRSVLESVSKFCRPDKSDSLHTFLVYLAGEMGIHIKSVMIHSLSHGNYDADTPTPEDVKEMCKLTLQVIEVFAPGQIAIIEKKTTD